MILLSFYSKISFFSYVDNIYLRISNQRIDFFCSWRKVRRICQSNKKSLPLVIFYTSPLMKLEGYITETDNYQYDISLPNFCRIHYKFFKIIIISHILLLTSEYICRIFFTLLRTKFCIFIFQECICQQSEKMKN